MKQAPITSVALIGLGALGIMYGDFFAEKLGRDHVVFLADADRCRRYEAAEITCNGRVNRFRFMTPEAYRAEFGAASLVMFTVKGTALDAAIAEADPVTDEDTVLLSVLNGISSEETIESHFGNRGAVVHCVAQAMDALRQGTSVTYTKIGELRIGITEKTPAKIAALSRLEAFFDRTQFAYQTEDDILRRMWCKWMLNVGVNQTCAALDCPFRGVQQPGPAREMMKAAMREVILLAKATGINVAESDLDEYVAIIDTLSPDGMPSMRQDTLAHRATEVELFAGTVIRKAEALRIDVPVNRRLYAALTALPHD